MERNCGILCNGAGQAPAINVVCHLLGVDDKKHLAVYSNGHGVTVTIPPAETADRIIVVEIKEYN